MEHTAKENDCFPIKDPFSRMENGVESTKGEGFLSRMALNDNKAGMEGLDRDKINKIIMESSKVDTNNLYRFIQLVLYGIPIISHIIGTR